MIKLVSLEKMSVCVEWTESDSIKGKEVRIKNLALSNLLVFTSILTVRRHEMA